MRARQLLAEDCFCPGVWIQFQCLQHCSASPPSTSDLDFREHGLAHSSNFTFSLCLAIAMCSSLLNKYLGRKEEL